MNIIKSMMQLNDKDIKPPSTKSDLEKLGLSLSNMDTIKNLGTMYQAKILYHVRKNWDKIDTEVTGFWNYSFYDWAKQFTQNDQTIPHKSTIDNKIAVYRDYVAEQLIEIPQMVVIDNKQVETNIMMVSYTKLLYARTTARSGKMTPELWSMVFDKNVSVAELNTKIHQIKDKEEINLYTIDGVIYVSNGIDRLPIGHLDYDESDKPLWRIGIEKLSKFCKIDEFVL